jgi:DHA2 family multidrug resistance protein
LGGWLTDNYSWPWIFFINLPIGTLAAILTFLFVHDSKYKRVNKGVDLTGIMLLAIGLGSLQVVLEKGNRDDWFASPFIAWMSVAAVIGIVGFVLWELHTPNPAVNLRVLRNRGFSAGVLFATVLGFGLFGGIFILPVFLQQLQHFTALQTGMMMLPGAMATAVVMPFAGKLVSHYPARNLVAFGAISFIISSLLLSRLTMDTGYSQMYWPLVLRGAAMGFLFVPLTLATLIGLKGRDLADGTGLFNLARTIGGSAGIAFLSTLLDRRMAFHRAILVEHVNLYSPATIMRLRSLEAGFLAKGSSPPVARQQALAVVDRIVQGQAAVLSYGDAFYLIAIFFVCALPLLLLFQKGKSIPSARPGSPAE